VYSAACAAEKFIENAEGQPGFAIMLLQFIKAVTDMNVNQRSELAAARQAAATLLKNLVKNRWAPVVPYVPWRFLRRLALC
jgi:hypothetical protein